jgi:hypothetical protein
MEQANRNGIRFTDGRKVAGGGDFFAGKMIFRDNGQFSGKFSGGLDKVTIQDCRHAVEARAQETSLLRGKAAAKKHSKDH